MTGVFTREEQAQRQIHKTPREDGGQDHNTTTIDEGTPKFYSHHQKVRGGRKSLGGSMAMTTPWCQTSSLQHCEGANPSSLVLVPAASGQRYSAWARSPPYGVSPTKKLQAFNYIHTRMFIATLIEMGKWINGQRQTEGRGRRKEEKNPRGINNNGYISRNIMHSKENKS